MNYQAVILSPLLTEKAAGLKAEGVYAFSVAKQANKIDVARAVEKIWGVKVTQVKVLRTKPKVKVMRSKSGEGRTATVKKAYVRLVKGQKIQDLEV